MGAGADPLAELAASSVDLTQALAELRGEGLREAVGRDVLRDADVSSDVLDRFLSLAVREVADRVLFGLALSLPGCIAWRDAGAEALDYCLRSRTLENWQREFVLLRLIKVEAPGESLARRHERVLAASVSLQKFALYETFLRKHIDDVLVQCRTEFDALVLDPAFPPTGYRLDCVILAIDRAPDPTPYQQKVTQWVASGDLDSDGRALGIFYSYLSDRLRDPRYAGLRSATYARLITLLRDPKSTATAWAHLSAALGNEFAGAAELLAAIRSSGVVLVDEQRTALEYPIKGLLALAAGGVGRDGQSSVHWLRLMLRSGPPA